MGKVVGRKLSQVHRTSIARSSRAARWLPKEHGRDPRGRGGSSKVRDHEHRNVVIAIPANVVVNLRASVTTGLANDVDDVNQ